MWAGELKFTDCAACLFFSSGCKGSPGSFVRVADLLHVDVRNNSAWNHRFFLVFESGRPSAAAPNTADKSPSTTSSTGEADAKVYEREWEYVKSKILLAPNNASAWNYLRGCVTVLASDCIVRKRSREAGVAQDPEEDKSATRDVPGVRLPSRGRRNVVRDARICQGRREAGFGRDLEPRRGSAGSSGCRILGRCTVGRGSDQAALRTSTESRNRVSSTLCVQRPTRRLISRTAATQVYRELEENLDPIRKRYWAYKRKLVERHGGRKAGEQQA